MVQFLPGWGHSAPASGGQAPTSSVFSETILAVAFSALALFSANIFDRANPGLATLLRCVAGGVGLIWLFNRCCPSGQSHVVHPHSGPVGPSPVPPPPTPAYWSSWFTSTPYVRPAPISHPPVSSYGLSHTVPMTGPGTGGFPTVHRAPAQPDPTPLYSAPLHRSSSPRGGVHTPPPPYSLPPQAKTTYSHAPSAPPLSQPQARTTHSHVQPAPVFSPPPLRPIPMAPTGFPTVHKAPAQPDPRPLHEAPVSRGFVPSAPPFSHSPQPTTLPMSHSSSLQSAPLPPPKMPGAGGFPTVHKAPAQPDPRPLTQAPLSRGSESAAPKVPFTPVGVTPVSGGFPSVMKPQSTGGPMMFPAAIKR